MGPRGIVSVRAAVVGLTLGLVAGCSDLGAPVDGGPPPEPTVSFAADIQPVFDAHCIGCHGASGLAGMDLRAGQAWANLVNIPSTSYDLPRVTPGDPERSVLYLKLSGAAGVGDRMPQGGSLDAATIERFRIWIVEGARDN